MNWHPGKPSQVLIGLGSNLGDRAALLDAAVATLAGTSGLEVHAVSSYHETAPVGGPGGQGAFLNAAAWITTTLDPHALLGVLREIEARAGRVRSVRWGERTLDLDLLLISGQRIDTPELTVPHPRMAVRRFVLGPAAEIAPAARDPRTGRRIGELLANLDRRPSYLALVGPTGCGRRAVFRRLITALGAAGWYEGSASVSCEEYVGSAPESPALIPQTLRPPGFTDRFPQACQELRGDRWPAEVWGDRWLVTDTWLDLFVVAEGLRPKPSRARWLRDDLLGMRTRVIQPTFVVLWEPPPETLPRHMADPDQEADPEVGRRAAAWERVRVALREHVDSPLCRVPVLRIATGDIDEVVAEALAACVASRAGRANPAVPVVGTEAAPL